MESTNPCIYLKVSLFCYLFFIIKKGKLFEDKQRSILIFFLTFLYTFFKFPNYEFIIYKI